MPRKYNRKTPHPGGNDVAFAAGLGLIAALRPMIQQIVRETVSEMFFEWVSKNAPTTVAPDDISRLGPNGAPKREG